MSNDKMSLVDKANQMKDDESIPTIGKDKEKEMEWDQVKEELVPAPDMIVFRVPEQTESGIVLPDGSPLIDQNEYRPTAEICGEEVEFVSPGDQMVLHAQAEQRAVPLKYGGHAIYMVHQQFVMGKASK